MKRSLQIAVFAIVLTFSFASNLNAMIYKNCTELRKAYPKGVAKDAKSAQTTGATVNAKVYNANKKSDRDKDGIICE